MESKTTRAALAQSIQVYNFYCTITMQMELHIHGTKRFFLMCVAFLHHSSPPSRNQGLCVFTRTRATVRQQMATALIKSAGLLQKVSTLYCNGGQAQRCCDEKKIQMETCIAPFFKRNCNCNQPNCRRN